MFSYEFYKVLHIVSLLVVFACMAPAFFIENRPKLLKICNGIFSLLLFVAGFGLLARINITTPWPTWVYAKVFFWFVIAIGAPMAMKRASPKQKPLFLLLFVVVAILAIITAVYKW